MASAGCMKVNGSAARDPMRPTAHASENLRAGVAPAVKCQATARHVATFRRAERLGYARTASATRTACRTRSSQRRPTIAKPSSLAGRSVRASGIRAQASKFRLKRAATDRRDAAAVAAPRFALRPINAGHAANLVGNGDRTMEDAVADLLRPLLKTWLAENMPKIVERALRREMTERLLPGQKNPRD